MSNIFSEIYHRGIFPLHNSFLLTIDFLLDFMHSLVAGTSSIVYVTKKIELLSQCESLSEQFQSNVQNHSKKIERACIAVLSILISSEDLDSVICLHCGVCPKVVNSDGNAKDSIRDVLILFIFFIEQ